MDAPGIYPGKWYSTQHEHWLGWLDEYHSPGAYGRRVDRSRDARYAYNHIVEWKMLVWLAGAAGVDEPLVVSARKAAARASSMQAGAAAVRRIVPWDVLEPRLRSKLSR